jgi:hypothetical protein
VALKTKASVSSGTEIQLLEADIYDAILAGVVVKPFQVYEGKPGDMQDKYLFIYQIPQDDAPARYLKSAPLAITINEKSNLYAKHLKALTGKSESDFGNDFDPSTLLGKQVRLEVSQRKSAKDGKTYNEIEKAMVPSKAKLEIEPGELNEFFVKGATEFELHPVLKVKTEVLAVDTGAKLDMADLASSLDSGEKKKRPAPIV